MNFYNLKKETEKREIYIEQKYFWHAAFPV